jgi:hypothetical protein
MAFKAFCEVCACPPHPPAPPGGDATGRGAAHPRRRGGGIGPPAAAAGAGKCRSRRERCATMRRSATASPPLGVGGLARQREREGIEGGRAQIAVALNAWAIVRGGGPRSMCDMAAAAAAGSAQIAVARGAWASVRGGRGRCSG